MASGSLGSSDFPCGRYMLHPEHGGSREVTPCGLAHSCKLKEVQGAQVVEYLFQVYSRYSLVSLSSTHLVVQLNRQVGQGTLFNPRRHGWSLSLETRCFQQRGMSPRDENCRFSHPDPRSIRSI